VRVFDLTKRKLFGLSSLVLLIGLALAFGPFGILEPKRTVDQKTLRFAVLPDQDEETLRRAYKPLFQYLEKATGLDIELVIPTSYDHLLKLFGSRNTDVANFGGLTFIKAQTLFGAEPLAMRDTDIRFRSYFLARTDRPEITISDFKGKRLGFGAKLSTSGHLMPRHFLMLKRIDPEAFFGQIEYSGTHDKTALWVRDGIVDLGAANAAIIDEMVADGRLLATDVRVIWRTPPFPDYVWATRKDLSPEVRKSLLEAFLQLSPIKKNHAEILKRVNAGGFLPANPTDFRELELIARSLGIS
jgi:phosphonate transport system substrate-binding protein